MSQWPYRFEILNVGKLFVDETYQRPLTNLARRIEREFDPALVGCLVVSDRGDGHYAIVDGQTRASAILNLSADDLAPLGVPCLVYDGLSRADEARLFAQLQLQRRGIASAHRFRAAVVAGDPESVAIEQLVRGLGYTIGPAGQGNISAVAALEKVYRRGPELLERSLRILRAAHEGIPPPGDVLRGLGLLLSRQEVDDDRMAVQLRTTTFDRLKLDALALGDGRRGGGGGETYMAQAIDAVYRGRMELAA